MKETVEVYTCKLETTLSLKSAKLAVVVSAQRGCVEDVNEAMNTLATTLRALTQEEAVS